MDDADLAQEREKAASTEALLATPARTQKP